MADNGSVEFRVFNLLLDWWLEAGCFRDVYPDSYLAKNLGRLQANAFGAMQASAHVDRDGACIILASIRRLLGAAKTDESEDGKEDLLVEIPYQLRARLQRHRV